MGGRNIEWLVMEWWSPWPPFFQLDTEMRLLFYQFQTNANSTTVLGQCLDLLEDDDDTSQAADDSKPGTPSRS